jgi:hypothetical protein
MVVVRSRKPSRAQHIEGSLMVASRWKKVRLPLFIKFSIYSDTRPLHSSCNRKRYDVITPQCSKHRLLLLNTASVCMLWEKERPRSSRPNATEMRRVKHGSNRRNQSNELNTPPRRDPWARQCCYPQRQARAEGIKAKAAAADR